MNACTHFTSGFLPGRSCGLWLTSKLQVRGGGHLVWSSFILFAPSLVPSLNSCGRFLFSTSPRAADLSLVLVWASGPHMSFCPPLSLTKVSFQVFPVHWLFGCSLVVDQRSCCEVEGLSSVMIVIVNLPGLRADSEVSEVASTWGRDTMDQRL